MTPEERQQFEDEVRRRLAEGDGGAAAKVAIQAFGPEILGFLTAQHRRESDADEVFAVWSEQIWRGLARFDWRCSLRTWAYAVARNASRNFERDRQVRARRHPPLPESAELAAIEERVRTETRSYMRTEAKDRFAEIRDALPADDRALLVLRVDKGLEWKDVARVMLGDDAAVDDDVLLKESQRLRKRFQHLKQRLVDEGRRLGILDARR
jgi:RNA polymerase sigma-70 factor, ECF subfamily